VRLPRCAVLALVPVVIAVVTGCSTPMAKSAAAVELTIKGEQVLVPQELQAQAEAELSYTLNFGYVARTGSSSVSCWFARTGLVSEVDSRLWCGPVQVPGTAAASDWVPVPLKEVGRTDAGVRLEVQPPQVPEQGSRSEPVGPLLRTDGSRIDPTTAGPSEAGAGFLAVLPDDGKRTNSELGLSETRDVSLRDDLLSVRATGWGSPRSWHSDDGELRARPGVRLRVLRLWVDQLHRTDPAFDQTPWKGWSPQPSELALELPGRRHVLPADRLPESGAVFVVYTVADIQLTNESLALSTVGTKSLEQRVAVPRGTSDAPAALRRPAGPDKSVERSQRVEVGGERGTLDVAGVHLGRQRPVKLGSGEYELATASTPDKALLELRLRTSGDGLSGSGGAWSIKDLISVTLPNGSKAPLVGVRYDGGVFPNAVVVEVPADVREVSAGLAAGTVTLPQVGSVAVGPVDGAIAVPLDF
jgi:hypothetical protein